jgi:hypothetical protein
MIELELLDDGRVAVSGLTIEQVRRLLPRPPGRPAGPEITRDEIFAALDGRRRQGWLDMPTQTELAKMLGVRPARLRDGVIRNFGSFRKLTAIRDSGSGGESEP